MNLFDEKYYEDGIANHISGYENYHWMPERTIREATSIIEKIEFNTVLDFGCAKGFMVYAMSLLGKDAYGVDISEYAVGAALPQVKDRLTVIETVDDIKTPSPSRYDLIMAKDVLEHIPYDVLPWMLKKFRAIGKNILVAVPLGENNKFRIRQYEMDITHIIREPEEFWLKALGDAGFKIKFFDYQMGHLKGNWTKNHQFGNAFIIGE
jgi:predicted TPR repeat methyltransferase